MRNNIPGAPAPSPDQVAQVLDGELQLAIGEAYLSGPCHGFVAKTTVHNFKFRGRGFEVHEQMHLMRPLIPPLLQLSERYGDYLLALLALRSLRYIHLAHCFSDSSRHLRFVCAVRDDMLSERLPGASVITSFDHGDRHFHEVVDHYLRVKQNSGDAGFARTAAPAHIARRVFRLSITS